MRKRFYWYKVRQQWDNVSHAPLVTGRDYELYLLKNYAGGNAIDDDPCMSVENLKAKSDRVTKHAAYNNALLTSDEVCSIVIGLNVVDNKYPAWGLPLLKEGEEIPEMLCSQEKLQRFGLTVEQFKEDANNFRKVMNAEVKKVD